MFSVNQLLRPNIQNLKAYQSARQEFKGKAEVYLDANENPYTNGLNRYPDPLQTNLKKVIGKIKNTRPENIFLGNGSDEAIDLLMRAFCEPGQSKILCFPPTYGMYKVSAAINDVKLTTIPLNDKFQIDLSATQ